MTIGLIVVDAMLFVAVRSIVDLLREVLVCGPYLDKQTDLL